MNKMISLLVMLGFAASASAGAYCYNETVTGVIIQNGTVYFTTNKSCPSWCAMPSSWGATAESQAFATLLAARTTTQTVSFYWNDQSTSCSNTEAVGSSPATIIF